MKIIIRNSLIYITLVFIIAPFFHCGSSTEKKDAVSVSEQTYKNLDSNVKYVGIIACRQCHYDKYETFIETGMGKSFDKATKGKSSAKLDKHTVVHDKFSGFSYRPFWHNDTMKIMEFRLQGKDTLYKRIETIDYIIGSGQHTNSHIMEENGYFSQMPMTFYTQDGKWDMPPGFENGYNTRFSRKIGLECMSCHNAFPDFTMGSENKFVHVPNGIDCERCHGPGEIHVKEKTAGIVIDTSKYIDYSIVNPAKLSADLQFDVCQRCHLQGNTVLKENKSFYDFRPGMKLSDVMTVFLPKYEGADDEFIMASHADRLKMSPCFMKSKGLQESDDNNLRPYKNELTCVTCHNPHVSVKVTGKEIFNNACKNCHGGKTNVVCTEKEEVRAKKQDNCVSCHMPRSGSIDIPHVTVTDHFIRKSVKKENIAGIKKFIGLVAINETHTDPKIKAEAYLNQYEKFDRNPVMLDSAKKYLADTSIHEIEENFSLLVRMNFLKNDFEKIVSYTHKLTKKKLLTEMLVHQSWLNEDAWTCYHIAESFTNTGKPDKAYPYYKKASTLSPYNLEFLNKLGGNLFSQNQYDEAKKIYEKIIAENSNSASAYCNLGFIYFMNMNFPAAERYYEKSLLLDPDYEFALMNKVQLYLMQGKNDKAKKIAQQMLIKNPKNEKAKSILEKMEAMNF